MPPGYARLLEEARERLRAAFGARLRDVVLYGSVARGEAGPDSDIDLLVLLRDEPVEPGDSWTCIEALYPIVLETGRPIHAEPVAASVCDSDRFPLYRNARREGIPL